jgi:hypothetical protein
MRKYLTTILAALWLAICLWQALPALATTYYLQLAEVDNNYAAGAATYRRINAAAGYPNAKSKTTRLVERYTTGSPSYSTVYKWNDSVHTLVYNALTTPEKAAVTTTDPGSTTSNYTKSAYWNEFDAEKAYKNAIVVDGDSYASSANGIYALSEPDRFYYQLNAMLPAGSQAIGLGIGGKTVAQLRSDFATKIANLNIPTGAQLHILLLTNGNDITVDGQTGWGYAYRIFQYVDTAKAAFPNAKVWVTTPMCRKDGSITAAMRDATVSLKDPANVTAHGYGLIDLGADARGTPMIGTSPLEQTDLWQGDLEHPTAKMVKAMAEDAYNTLFPDPTIHPALIRFGSFWFKPIVTASATYTAITTSDAGPNTHHEPGLGYNTFFYGDRNRLIDSVESDPFKTFIYPGAFNNRDIGSVVSVYKARVPTSWVVPDVIPSNTPNEAGWFYNTDTGVFMPGNTICIPTAGGNVYAYAQVNHAGSGINAPPVLKRELDAGLIKHALALNISGLRLYWDSGTSRGWQAPAVNDDAGANASTYLGVQSKYRLGTKVAIPPGVTANSLGLTDPQVIAVFNALKTYGGYLVDTTSIGPYPWGWSIGLEDTVETALDDNQTEMRAIAEALQIVEET